MKKIIPLIFVSLLICPSLHAQIHNQFTWDNSSNERIADFGPDATNSGSLAEAQPAGSGGSVNGLAPGSTIIPNPFGGPIVVQQDIDLTLGNTGTLNQSDIEYSIDYRRDQPEVNGAFFSRAADVSGREFFLGIEYGKLTLRFTWDDGSPAGRNEVFTLLGYWVGDEIPTDATWRNYLFSYESSVGLAALRVNGVQVWTLTTAPNASILWPSTPAIIGFGLDNLGVDLSILDNALIQTPEPLPVEWGTFAGTQAQHSIQLDWETYSQINFDYFEVEYAPDGRSFRPMGRVGGLTTTPEAQQYTFTHEQPQIGANYYRLRQVDMDGSVHYSKRIEVRFGLDATDVLSFFPNPVADRLTIGINEPSTQASRIQLEIYDLSGRVLHQSTQEMAPQQQETYLNTQRLAPGAYLLKVSWQGRTAYHKLTK